MGTPTSNPPDDIANFPLEVLRFGNEYRVVAVAGDTDKRALGARIVKIGDMPFAKVRDLLLSLTPQDENPNLGPVVIEQTMTQGLYLHGRGIIPDRETASYTLADQRGKEFTIRVRGTKMAESKTWDWTYVSREAPLYRKNPKERFWAEYLPESRTMYCNFRGYNTLEKDTPGWMELVKSKTPDKVVIDLRQNGGGDFTLGQKFVIDPLRALPNVNQKGHLFVLISPYTFSAAMANAAQFRSTTAAILVGEPIGEKPNSFQEAREMRLPNSHLVARYSTLRYTFVDGSENVVRPDKEIDRDWKSYLTGRDPVLEWVLAYKN
jgi:Peptidase family S41